jgi:NTE family protein
MSGHKAPKPINLALQGGGAHGAFTWGVLDALLEDGRLRMCALSGTSAGAMNAVALADGWVTDGVDGARQSLSDFWNGIAASSQFSNPSALWTSLFDPFELFDSMTAQWVAGWMRNTSPYVVNPLNINPLRDVIDRLIDFEKVRACEAFELFVAATHVQSGRIKIFRRAELTTDHLLASACLPFLFQAVEIDGEAYWDGGYVGNPPLWPFFYESDCDDILVVQINPIRRDGVPKTIEDIVDRMTEISFNASLLREYRNIDFVKRLIGEGALKGSRYRDVLLHQIDGGNALANLSASSRLVARKQAFDDLFKRGRNTALEWLDRHHDAVGKTSSFDVAKLIHGE